MKYIYIYIYIYIYFFSFGGGGGGLETSEFFYKESKESKSNFFSTKNPNRK